MDFLDYQVIPDPPLITQAGWLRLLRDVLETLVMALVLFLIINALTARIRVESISMQPNLYAGDFVLVNRLAYRWAEPEHGDIVVFKYPPNPAETPYIKRVIGLPGETVKVQDGKLYVNGQLVSEPYLTVYTNMGGEWHVPAESLFVMGDNRNSSSDSRAWGFVPYDNIIGKALFVYYPYKHWAWLDGERPAYAASP